MMAVPIVPIGGSHGAAGTTALSLGDHSRGRASGKLDNHLRDQCLAPNLRAY